MHMYNCIQAFQFEYFPTFISLYTTLLSKEIYIYLNGHGHLALLILISKKKNTITQTFLGILLWMDNIELQYTWLYVALDADLDLFSFFPSFFVVDIFSLYITKLPK